METEGACLCDGRARRTTAKDRFAVSVHFGCAEISGRCATSHEGSHPPRQKRKTTRKGCGKYAPVEVDGGCLPVRRAYTPHDGKRPLCGQRHFRALREKLHSAWRFKTAICFANRQMCPSPMLRICEISLTFWRHEKTKNHPNGWFFAFLVETEGLEPSTSRM